MEILIHVRREGGREGGGVRKEAEGMKEKGVLQGFKETFFCSFER